MSDRERLQFDVTADTKDATKKLGELQKDVDELEGSEAEVSVDADTKSAEAGLEKVETKAKGLDGQDFGITVDAKVDAVFGALDKVVAKTKETQEAADALGRALGPELAAKADTVAVVGDLERMGLTLDDIKTNADELGAKMRELADADVGGKLGSSLGTTRGKLDELGASADSSKSVLANMVGNSAQDIGTLGGVAGSAGVAIGQMGEYMADALSSGERLGSVLRSFAGVAGPIAALAVATEIFSVVMKGLGERNKIAAESQEAWIDALREGGNAAENYAEHLRDTEKVMAAVGDNKGYSDVAGGWVEAATKFGAIGLTIDAVAKTFGIFGQKTQDISGILSDAGFTAESWARAVAAGTPALGQAQVALQKMGVSTDDQRIIMEALTDEQDAFAKSNTRAAEINKFFGAKVDDTSESLAKSKREMADAADELERWTEETANALEGQQAYADGVAGMDWGAAPLDAAVSAMSRFTEQNRGLVNINADTEAAFDDLTASVKENGATFDVTTEKGRANQAALEDVAKALDTKLAAAYVDAKGDQDKFTESAKKLAEDTLTRLQKELGLSDEDTAALGASLGLLPDDITTRYKLAGDEEARLKIGLLQGAIDRLPPDVQTKVTQQIITGDYVGALNTVQGYYNRNPAEVKTTVDAPSSGALAAVGGAIGAYYSRNPVPVRAVVKVGAYDKGGTVGPDGGIAGETGAEFVDIRGRRTLVDGATWVPAGARVTSRARTRAILQRVPRYAQGTATGSELGNVSLIIEGNVYGDSHLRAMLDRALADLAATIRAGRRP